MTDPEHRWDWEQYRPVLWLLARGLIHRTAGLKHRLDESDLVQQTLLRAWQARDQIQGTTDGDRLRWLRVVLVNQFRDALDHLHADKRDPALERSLDEVVTDSGQRLEAFLAAAHPSPSWQAMNAELRLDVAAALWQLPADDREAVLGHDLEGKSLRDLARELGLDKNGVARRVAAGRRRLRTLLAGHQ